MSALDAAALPTPSCITLFFKHDKSTVVLSVAPDQPFSEIKAMLVEVLRSRGVLNFPGTTVPLPTNPDEMDLGVAIDRRDPSKGWLSVHASEAISEVKAGKKKAGTKPIKDLKTFGDLDPKDGTWIAYRLRPVEEDEEVTGQAKSWNVAIPVYTEDEELDDVEEMDDAQVTPKR